MPKAIIDDGGLRSHKIVTGCSTWKKTEKPNDNWNSESKEKFKSKEELMLLESNEWNLPIQRGLETERDILRDKSVDKFKSFATKFGSAKDLFTSIDVDIKSNISLQEFTNKLKEYNYDIFYSRDEQRLLFEKLTYNSADGKVPVIEIMKIVNNNNLNSGKKTDNKKQKLLVAGIKHDITQQLFHKNKNVRLDNDAKAVGKQIENALLLDPTICDGTINHENLNAAFGSNYLDIKDNKGSKEILLEDAQCKLGTEVPVHSFVRYLNVKESSMDVIPLHDARAANLARLNTKIQDIEQACTDPDLIDRVNTLTISLGRTKNNFSTTNSLSTLRPRTSSNLNSLHNNNNNNTLTKSMSNLNCNDNNNNNKLSINSSIQLSPLKKSFNNKTLDDLCTSSPPTVSPMGKSSSLFPPPDFSPTLAISKDKQNSTIKPKKKSTRHRDPVDVIAEEIALAKTPRHEGVRLERPLSTDWTRIGIGGNGINNHTGLYLEPEQQFMSVTMAKFPSVIYEPGIGPTRNIIGDAEKLFLERENCRNKRYERTFSNLQITKDRLELEQLEETIKDMRTTQKSAIGLLNYSSNVFLKDMKDLKRQPLQSMQKKSNPLLFTKMWKGTFHPAHTLGPIENKQFKTEHEINLEIEDKTFAELMKEELHKETISEDRDFLTVYNTTYKRENTLFDKKNLINHYHDPNFHRPGTSIN